MNDDRSKLLQIRKFSILRDIGQEANLHSVNTSLGFRQVKKSL